MSRNLSCGSMSIASMPDTWANKSRNGLYSNCYLRRLENDLKIIRKKKKKKKHLASYLSFMKENGGEINYIYQRVAKSCTMILLSLGISQ